MNIHIEVVLCYGYKVMDELKEFKRKIIREIENLTAMNVENVAVVAKGLYIPERGK